MDEVDVRWTIRLRVNEIRGQAIEILHGVTRLMGVCSRCGTTWRIAHGEGRVGDTIVCHRCWKLKTAFISAWR